MPDRGGEPPPERPSEPRPRVIFRDGAPGRGATERAPAEPPPLRPVDPLRRLRKDGDDNPLDRAGEAPRPAIRFGEASPPAPAPDRPRVVAGGQVRQRMTPAPLDFWVLDPLAPDPIVEAASRAVEGLNLDDAPLDAVARFGRASQEEHARLSEEALARAGDTAAEEARAPIGRLLDRLRDLEPDAVLGIPGEGLLGALLTLAEPPPDPDAVFHAGYPELRAAAASLAEAGEHLAAEAERLRLQGERLDELDRRLYAQILAARFAADRVRADAGDRWPGSLADALDGRARSLSATRGTLDGARRTLAASRDRLAALLDTIRRTTDEDLPAWRTAYAAVLPPASTRDAGWRSALDGLRAAHARITNNLQERRAA